MQTGAGLVGKYVPQCEQYQQVQENGLGREGKYVRVKQVFKGVGENKNTSVCWN